MIGAATAVSDDNFGHVFCHLDSFYSALGARLAAGGNTYLMLPAGIHVHNLFLWVDQKTDNQRGVGYIKPCYLGCHIIH